MIKRKEKAMEGQRSFFQDPANRQWWIDQLLSLRENPQNFESLVFRLYDFQRKHCPAYKTLTETIANRLSSWKEIPAIPQELFKKETIFCYTIEQAAGHYLTSGTTSGIQGRHYFLDPLIYKAVSLQGANEAAIPIHRACLHFLTESPNENPHSSLSAMFSFWAESNPFPSYFWIQNKTFCIDPFIQKLNLDISAGRNVGICGTAFSFVLLMEKHPKSLSLPQGSFILETGGMKGKHKEIDKKEFYQKLSSYFGITQDCIFSEYGMTELSSQAYSKGTDGTFLVPPWAKVLVIDPRTEKECQVGQKGLVRWIDLANVDSVLCIQTLDIAIKTQEGFYLIGRSNHAPPRGCSLSIEEIAFFENTHR
ncbi:acyl-protein synthetase [Methylacidiphilum sp. Yel]|nr:acyl-protein synthetase [Methylacidiphilum sp. Yel]